MDKAQTAAKMLDQLNALRDPQGFFNAGIPNYDHLFGRDSAITALQMLHREPETARATLTVLAKYQGAKQRLRREEWPGKILHEHYPYGLRDKLDNLLHNDHKLQLLLGILLWRFPYYGSVDAGAWWLILLHHYHAQTGDAALVKRMWPAVEGILHWLDHHPMRRNGLVTFRSHFFVGLKNQSWKDSLTDRIEPPIAMVEVQGYYYYALGLTAQLAESVLADAELGMQIQARAERIKAAFKDNFVPENGVFPMAVGGDGHRFTKVVSNPGQLLFTGILDKAQAEMVVRRLLADDMLTPYGVRTEATSEATFDPNSYQNGSVWPFDNWVIHQGLMKYGYREEAGKLADGMAEVFERWGNLPELYAVERDGELHGIHAACYIQAWSAGALVNLLDGAPLL